MAATLTANGVAFSDGSTINGTTFNTVGNYCLGYLNSGLFSSGALTLTAGGTFAAGGGRGNIQSALAANGNNNGSIVGNANNLSGTWRYLGPSGTLRGNDCVSGYATFVAVRTA